VSDELAALRQLPAKGVETVLEELGALRRREKAGEALRIPLVTLHLRTGRDLQGFVLDVVEHRPSSSRLVLLHQPGSDPRRPEYDATYLAASSIEAVTVHDAVSLSKAPADAPAPPSRLELKRQLAALQAELRERLGTPIEVDAQWDSAPDEGEGQRTLADLVSLAGDELRGLAKEALGRDALKANVQRIRLNVGKTPGVAVSNGTLAIATTASWPDRMTRDNLKRLLETAL
jgi:hypothetical protein